MRKVWEAITARYYQLRQRLQRNKFHVFYFLFQISYPYYTLHHHTLTHIYSHGAMYKMHHPTDNQICAIFADNPQLYTLLRNKK
jgi:hypothetical protein